MKVLLLSAYDAASHKRWRQGLVEHFPEYQWHQLVLPARHFNWRIRGNSLSWAFSEQEILTQHYDLLIATSMVDLSALRGFVPSLSQLPTVVYFHENQFAYPSSNQQHVSIEPQIVNLYTALCADAVVFNSDYNRQSFIRGALTLLKKLPDQVPKGLLAHIESSATVLPVPLESKCFVKREDKRADDHGGHYNVVWNHRWEYDKGPDRLYTALKQLLPKQLPIKWHIVGQQFRQSPPEFEAIYQLLIEYDALGTWGYLESAQDYLQLLSKSHAVVSTALHDFQGLAVMEAVAAGCMPILPNRQAYPQWFGADVCYRSDLDHPESEAQALVDTIVRHVDDYGKGLRKKAPGEVAVPSLSHLSWHSLKPSYQALFESITETTL